MTGKELASYTYPEMVINNIAFNPVFPTLATTSTDKTIKYWDLKTLSLVRVE